MATGFRAFVRLSMPIAKSFHGRESARRRTETARASSFERAEIEGRLMASSSWREQIASTLSSMATTT
jgi:hypothetical protein